MKPGLPAIDRRTLLIGGGAGIGLVIAFLAWPRRSATTGPGGERLFGQYLKIGSDGRVTVTVPQVETGQGIWTSLPQLVADELGAAWETVGVDPAPLASDHANPLAAREGWFDGLGTFRRHRLAREGAMRMTAGSTSMRAFEMPFRQAGATARAMLVAAAADLWGVDSADCDTADGFVIHGVQRLPFAALAESAAASSPPRSPQLRQPGERRLAGQALPRLDLPPKSDGSFRFAADVRLPGMVFAAARILPSPARLSAFSREAAERIPGVREVIARNGWIAAVADNGWAAQRGLQAAQPRFAAPADGGADLRFQLQAAMDGGEARTLHSRGDYSATVRERTVLTADYWVGPAAHQSLEPVSATARFRDGKLELWAASQAPELARRTAADVAGLNPGDVTFYPVPSGDPSGRALEAGAVPIAVDLAKILGRPVQLTLSQFASQNVAPVAPPVLARLFGMPGTPGIAAWRSRVATADGMAATMARLTGTEPPGDLRDAALAGAAPPYAIPNLAIDAVHVPLSFPIGYMRGHPESALAFATESFVDELARATGVEALAFRMALLGRNVRLAHCIARAAALGDWDGGGRGSTLGLAACSAYGSHIGLLADATIAANQRIAVHRLVAVVDCGRIANPGIVRQQIEGGLIWGLGQATAAAPKWRAGIPLAQPFGMTGLPLMAASPEIAVELVASQADPGGVSSLGAVPVAAAVANAIYAGTGRRLRSLPFDPMSGK